MKGSAVLLLACFALFLTAPSHSYSVKFISEDDQVANRQDTESGSPSPDVATTGDAVRSENSDKSADESGTVKMDGVAGPPVNESIPEGYQGEKSNIRKRDTRSLVRDIMADAEGVENFAVSIRDALNFIRAVGDTGHRCFKRIIDHLEMTDSPIGSDESQMRLTRARLITWLNFIRSSLPKCLRLITIPLEDAVDDGAAPVADKPGSTLVTMKELVYWFIKLGKTLETCFKYVIRILEESSEGQTDPVQRSSDTVPDLLAELIEILAKINGAAVAVEEPGQAMPYPDPLITVTSYKRRNGLDKARGMRHLTNLPSFPGSVIEDPGSVVECDPWEKCCPDTPNSMFPKFRDELAREEYPPMITTLQDVYDPQRPDPSTSLLDLVLQKIYSKLQDPVEIPDVGVRATSDFFRSPGNRRGTRNPDIAACIEDCLEKPGPGTRVVKR